MGLDKFNLTFNDYTTSVMPSSVGLGADFYVRQLLINATNNQSNITSFYKELLRYLKTLFGNFIVIKSDDTKVKVKCILGSPERAIAKQKQQDSIILPLIAIEHILTNTDQDKRHYNPTYSAESYWDDKKQRAFRVISLVPKAITVEYEVSIWSYYQEDLDQLTEQIHRLFNPSVDVNLPFTRHGKVFLTSEFSDSELEVEDQVDRTRIGKIRIWV
jgi:hypothetical protein